MSRSRLARLNRHQSLAMGAHRGLQSWAHRHWRWAFVLLGFGRASAATGRGLRKVSRKTGVYSLRTARWAGRQTARGAKAGHRGLLSATDATATTLTRRGRTTAADRVRRFGDVLGRRARITCV